MDNNWNLFLQYAKQGRNKNKARDYRQQMCNAAVKFGKQLVDKGVIINMSEEQHKIYQENLDAITKYLDGLTSLLEKTSEIYFTLIYASKGYQLHNILIDFEDKPDGVSQGRVCKINLEGTEELFFVKCHHNGPRPSQSQYSNSGAPDVRELFVYKVFELLNILGNVYFFVPSNGRPWDLFIATEGVKNLNLFGDLKKEVNLPALAFIELLQFVLQLRDVGTNLSNCGQTEDGKPVIVDFSIPDYQEDFVLNAEDIMAYLAAKEYSQLARRQEPFRHMIKELNTDLKKNAIGQLSCMKFKEQLDKASLDIEKFLTDTSGKLEVDQRGYNEYVQAIKTNFDNIFSQT